MRFELKESPDKGVYVKVYIDIIHHSYADITNFMYKEYSLYLNIYFLLFFLFCVEFKCSISKHSEIFLGQNIFLPFCFCLVKFDCTYRFDSIKYFAELSF